MAACSELMWFPSMCEFKNRMLLPNNIIRKEETRGTHQRTFRHDRIGSRQRLLDSESCHGAMKFQALFRSQPVARYSQLEILNPFPILLKGHTSGIVAQDDNIEQGDLDQIQGNLLRKSPFRGNSVERARGGNSRGDLFKDLWRIERLEALL